MLNVECTTNRCKDCPVGFLKESVQLAAVDVIENVISTQNLEAVEPIRVERAQAEEWARESHYLPTLEIVASDARQHGTVAVVASALRIILSGQCVPRPNLHIVE